MHKIWKWNFVVVTGLVLLTIFSKILFAAESSLPTLVLLHTNDIHGHLTPWRGWEGDLAEQTVGGLDRVAARVREIRDSVGKQRVLLLDAGDTIGDSLIAAQTEGQAIVKTMNAMNYDAMVIGNHEPDFSAEKLRQRIAEANFPVLAANIVNSGDASLFTKPYLMREVNGVRIGILGIAYPNTPLTSAQKNVRGLRYRQAVDTAREYVPRMRAQGAQLVIALTHLGISADKELAQKVSGIDVIVGGHSHNRMQAALRVGNTLIVQAGAHGSDLGRLDLNIENGRIVSYQRQLLPITSGASDATTARIIETQNAAHASALNEKIGRAANPIIRPQTIAGQEPQQRDAESPADKLFADAMREITGQEIAFLPGVGYGVAIQPGDINADALRNLIPHDSAVWTMKLSGAEIQQTLEQSIENFMTHEAAKKVGGMIQVSGMTFSYDPNQNQGRRVQQVRVGGKPLSASRQYGVAVNALLAEGGHNYTAFTRGSDRREVGKEYEMVSRWIKQAGTVSAPSDQRVTKLAEAKE